MNNAARISRFAMAFLLLSISAVLAQSPVGNISGTVTDPSGAVIPGAAVTAVSFGSGGSRTATTNDQGFFLIATLQAGPYKVTVDTKGFQPFVYERVVVGVGQTARADAQLSVTGSVETVKVAGGDVAAVDTSQATVGGIVSTKQINDLPLNGRNYLELAKLEPGVEIQEGRAFDPTKARYTGISIGGRQGREARISIDGVDAVDEHVGTTTLNLSQESIQEFQVSTSSSDASTGLSATGGVNIITKRGTNEYHGTGFIFGRASDFAARTTFAAAQPDFNRKQYGFSGGGPVIKNKLFVFGNLEKTDENSAIGVSTPYFPSITSFAAPFNEKSSTVRADWKVTQNHDFFFRWSFNDNTSFGGFGGNRLPSVGNFNTNRTNQYAGGLDSVLTPRLTNAFRVAYTAFQNRILVPSPDAAAIIIPGTAGFRIATDDGLLISGPDTSVPQSTSEKFNQIRDDLTYTIGKHTLRFGGDVTYRRISVFNFVSGFPGYSVVSPSSRNPADILDSLIISATFGNKNGKRIPGTDDNTHRNTRISSYFTDNWRITPNFTLNVGVRYQVDTHPLNNDLVKPDIAAPLLPNGTKATPLDANNFAPQIGFAWDPFKDHKTAIRVGAGIYYALSVSNLVTNERNSLAPFNSGNDTITLNAGDDGKRDFNRDGKVDYDFTSAVARNIALKNSFPLLLAGQQVYVSAAPSTFAAMTITRSGLLISNNFQMPYSQQLNAGIQRELGWNSVIDVNFIYSRTVHEFTRDVDAGNLFPGNGPKITLGDGLVTNAQITRITTDGFSRYRGLTAKFDKRFSKRFQSTASYALSRFETTSPDGLGLGSAPLVNRNIKANFGPGALDRTHRLTINAIAELPWGFRLSMLSTMSSALPTTAIVGSADLNGDGVNGDLLPGTKRGSLGRGITGAADLNALIRAYNTTTGGKSLPRSGFAPYVLEVPDSVRFGDSFISQDLALSKTFKIKERIKVELTAQMFNALNISNLVGAAGLPGSAFNGQLTVVNAAAAGGAPGTGFRLGGDGSLLNTAGNRALAGVDRASGFASFGAVRPSIPTGTGLPRAGQFGLRVSF